LRTCKVRPSFWVKLAVTRRCTVRISRSPAQDS
jgi:hypothetical protein